MDLSRVYSEGGSLRYPAHSNSEIVRYAVAVDKLFETITASRSRETNIQRYAIERPDRIFAGDYDFTIKFLKSPVSAAIFPAIRDANSLLS